MQIAYCFMDDTCDFPSRMANVLDNMNVLCDKYSIVFDVTVVIAGVILTWSYDTMTDDTYQKKILSTAKLFVGAESIDDFRIVLKLTPKQPTTNGMLLD